MGASGWEAQSVNAEVEALRADIATAQATAERYRELEELAKDWRYSNEFIGLLFRRAALTS
jgi:hypothetical protein